MLASVPVESWDGCVMDGIVLSLKALQPLRHTMHLLWLLVYYPALLVGVR